MMANAVSAKEKNQGGKNLKNKKKCKSNVGFDDTVLVL